jgi:NAD dependent epimerase/dehydratase family enzyme
LIDTPQARRLQYLCGAIDQPAVRPGDRQSDAPAFIFPVPAFIIRLLFGEMSTVVLDGQRVSAQRLSDPGFQFHYLGAEAALRIC